MDDEQEIDNNAKIEYVKSTIENIKSYEKYNLLFITFDLGAIVLLLNKFIFIEQSQVILSENKLLFIAAIILLILSAAAFAIWLALLHRLLIESTDALFTLDIENLRKWFYPHWEYYKKWGWINVIAVVSMIVGILFSIYLIISIAIN